MQKLLLQFPDPHVTWTLQFWMPQAIELLSVLVPMVRGLRGLPCTLVLSTHVCLTCGCMAG